MARTEKMVTRTIEMTRAYYTGLYVTDSQVYNGAIDLIGNFDKETALKKAKMHLETEDFKIVVITDLTITEKLYGMPEYEFIQNAVELDPETRKPL